MKILAVGPHPDDVEFGCAALLIQELRKGNHAKILVLSKGEASTSGTPEERVEETRQAAQIIGAELEFIDLGGDCHLRHTPENAIAIARHIRQYRPEIILAPNFDENQHPDHLATARMVRDAARLARYGGLEELRPLPVHSISNLYLYSITQSFGERPHIIVDTSDVEEQWQAAMRCHKTQMKTKAYINLVMARARALGTAIGTSSAIGLWVNDPVRITSISDLTLSSRNY
ncbi:MAG: PIG-L family deacetylase [Bryobacterales bacterium]|nr:PIG-L family deacetylase [Bryobacterales bacterium]MBV9396773.1 PIG-L family deacetylase [Bryobacterales bacterium]